ncbi:hypothetical protein X797_012386 [Metarhizium robertsii]|uniref:Uncharacterized protein n=2 Tax=Metarhizium robertsii TaxID=568076 RepID=E9FE72_METRA|nr:uncharacterized protein MAA_10571 [Metarhizium robertsii ARSEF 23]EFY93968.1 hypothetical protein MAA_10571 [Metarhizium robertsii ARSEF 23]EXU94544.1 hypothetical protein X797_012386 [Metarhizium robertsii]
MKTAVGVVFTVALAAALPNFERSNPTCDGDKAKLPWLPHGGEYRKCDRTYVRMMTPLPSREDFEKICGTDILCEAYETKYLKPHELEYITKLYGYKSDQECYDAHDSDPKGKDNVKSGVKLPWVEHGGDIRKCDELYWNTMTPLTSKDIEKICGTEIFCEAFKPEDIKPQELEYIAKRFGYRNHHDCYAARELEPEQQ